MPKPQRDLEQYFEFLDIKETQEKRLTKYNLHYGLFTRSFCNDQNKGMIAKVLSYRFNPENPKEIMLLLKMRLIRKVYCREIDEFFISQQFSLRQYF